jgi:hypothetical protein
VRRIWEIIRGRQDYSLGLVLLEIWGNLVGPLAFWQAVRQHRRLNGPGANPIGRVVVDEDGRSPKSDLIELE